jgi:hypothetical protein
VYTGVVTTGVAATVSVEPGEGIGGAGFERGAEDVLGVHGGVLLGG